MKRVLLARATFVALATSAMAWPYPKTISAKKVTEVIRQNLQYHAPQYIVLLDDTYPDAGVRDLVRVGLLETDSTTEQCGPKWRLRLTEKGEVMSLARGWSVYHDMLTIQVGSFRYIPNSAKVWRDSGHPDGVRFQFQYVPNANAQTLLRIGPARDWETGDGLTLADAGHTFVRSMELSYNSAPGWYLLEEWASRRLLVC